LLLELSIQFEIEKQIQSVTLAHSPLLASAAPLSNRYVHNAVVRQSIVPVFLKYRVVGLRASDFVDVSDSLWF